jgi:predicted ribosomally synthesized peptide with nif11-like leader
MILAKSVMLIHVRSKHISPLYLRLKIMAREQVARLYRAAQTDSRLKAKLNEAPDLEGFVEMAKAEGYDFTIEEWQQMTNFEVEELKCHLSEIPGI